MDAVKLKNSCVCGNIRPYLECCGRFAQPPDAKGIGEAARTWADFRHAFHELYMYMFPLKNLYQAYWEKLSQEKIPHQKLMAVPDYGRMVMANFFWDYSVQFSDARPILRAARDLDAKNLRMANDFRQWSLSPAWIYFVLESDSDRGHVRMLGTGKVLRILHGGEFPDPGSFLITRILPFRGEQILHPAILPLTGKAMDEAFLEEKLFELCQTLGIKIGAGLRPDIHCEEWRGHGALLLALWRKIILDGKAGVSGTWINSPLPELNGQTPVQASKHDIGRRKLIHILQDFSLAGRDVSAMRRKLGI